MPDLDEITLAKLAREIAMNIRPWHQIFADFGIDETDYYEINKIDFFIRAREQFTLEWNATTSTGDRVKIGSLAYLEQLLPAITRRALDMREPLVAATDVAKLLAKNAGVGEAKAGDKPASERFVITINLGADVDGKPVVEKYDKSIEIDAHDIAGGDISGTGATRYEKPALLTTTPPAESAYDIALASLMEKG
jgi:hypothetical protein